MVRYNLYDEKRTMTSLPNTLNDADGVILASTVEWLGLSGYMVEFLDACWLYGNKEKIAQIYMCPVVMSTSFGERDARLKLQSAWDLLGGKPLEGLCGYIEDTVTFELNKDYMAVVENAAENLYRMISQKRVTLPASSQAVRQVAAVADPMPLTPQETEQLSKYASDENYVQTQKEDIKELASHFRTLMENNGASEEDMIISGFKNAYRPQSNLSAAYQFKIKKLPKPLALELSPAGLQVEYREIENPTLFCKISSDKLNEIMNGRKTFQRAFMAGELQIRGDLKMLLALDTAFSFGGEAS